MDQKNLFILAGNASYESRGCEAIFRGTTEILRHHFAEPEFLAVGFFQNDEQFRKQVRQEHDNAIVHHHGRRPRKKFSLYWFLRTGRFSGTVLRASQIYEVMLPCLKRSQAVLSIGGDNYSLDYGTPNRFTMLDDLVLARKKPLIIWGASVGPFDKRPDYEEYMVRHLRKATGIYVRETVSLEYLAQKGVKNNVRLVADPAFLLKPVEPAAPPKLEEGAIGINLSELMARIFTDGNRSNWVALGARIVREIHRVTGRKIYLIPHDTRPGENDHLILQDVLSLLDGVDAVLVGDKYNAAETKWIIGKMAAFAGARMHSAIAAISNYIPTLSFVYSIKARGINRDIFGDERYCILKKEDCRPVVLARRMQDLLDDAPAIREHLRTVIPEFADRALSAGQHLKEICK